MNAVRRSLFALSIVAAAGVALTAQQPPGRENKPPASKQPPQAQRTFGSPEVYAPDVTDVATTSELRDLVMRYGADRTYLQRFYTIPGSLERADKLRAFYAGWLKRLPDVPFDTLSQQGKVDYVLLRSRIESDLRLLDREARTRKAIAPLLPFADDIITLQETRQKLVFVDAAQALASVEAIQKKVAAAQSAIAAGTITATAGVAIKAVRQLDAVRTALTEWYTFYNGYDPAFSAKVPKTYQTLNASLGQYNNTLREKLAGMPPGASLGRLSGAPAPGGGGGGNAGGGGGANAGANASPGAGSGAADAAPLVLGERIIGDPVGRDGLLEDLQTEMIVYTPEQLLEIGKKEYAWCEAEMKKASRELGFGDDWKAALEYVKNGYVARGKQPELVRNLQIQAEKFVTEHDLVTIPPIVHDNWRMIMMEPRRMRSAPFFLGGESILVSYPVEGMGEQLSEMIMKGNGPHLSHATVFHELIPGHNLQMYMTARYNAHRSLFSTPFYGEGWALYWELLLWDMGFHASPEDRIGALFWRMHRSVRILFTLNYQMGNWSPAQCVEFLVSNGHERYTAEGEVRGHVQNTASLYQISYLMGALQIRSLYKSLVEEQKKFTTKQFNDAFLRTGPMPIEMVRALLENRPLTRDYKPQWKYYGELPVAGTSAAR